MIAKIAPFDEFGFVCERLGIRSDKDKVMARCPAHEDSSPSLSIERVGDGKALINCFAGCEYKEIIKALGLHPKSFKPADDQIIAEYIYKDENGINLFKVIRKFPKKFFQARALGNTGWESKAGCMNDCRRVPYRLPEIVKSPGERLFWVEGEKDVGTLEKWNLLATTTAGGSKSFRKTDPEALEMVAYGREIIIIPDNDDAGKDYLKEVQAYLGKAGFDFSVRYLPKTINGKTIKDITDAYEAGWKKEDLEKFLESSAADDAELATEIEMDPFPVEEVFPPEIAVFIREASKALMVDPAAVALPALGAVASAIGNTRALRINSDWKILSCLWVVLLMKSGSNKSAAIRIATNKLNQLNEKLVSGYMVAVGKYEQESRAWLALKPKERELVPPPEKPSEPRLVVNDITIEKLGTLLSSNPKGLLMLADELANWFSGHERYSKGNTSGFWLGFYEGTSTVIDRQIKGTLVIKKPLVSIVGGIQPGILGRLLQSAAWSSGLAPRFLMANPPQKPRKYQPVPNQIPGKDRYEEAIQFLAERLEPRPFDPDQPAWEDPVLGDYEVEMNEEAFKLWWDDHDARGVRLNRTEGGHGAQISKLLNLPARWALCHHALTAALLEQQGLDQVGVDSIRAGIRLAAWMEREMARCLGVLAKSAAGMENDQWLRLAQGRGEAGITPRDLQTANRRMFPDAETARGKLNEMVALGLLVREKVSGTGGRPKEVWIPKSLRTKDTK